ncbi:MAG: CoA:oxalate CoA-transferase [Chloroflexi bacterium]|nr:MAG: CoA:oxalate CoA-transferase [Chloroflexota bacterium]
MKTQALKNVRVLDLTHYISGPYCTKLLGDFGADIIKIENPLIGDPCRNMPPFDEASPDRDDSLLFQYLNTNKKSVELNLKSDFGHLAVEKLVKESDILVESFRPGTLASYGFTESKLHTLNPNLVIVSISNFGQTGPYKYFEATDLIFYALGGLMFIFGSTNKPPLKHAFHQAQFKAGTNAASAALMAYYEMISSGDGQKVDISIQESMAASVRDTTTNYAASGIIHTRQPLMNGELPRAPIQVKDGYIVPITFGSTDWSKTANLLEDEGLSDAKFQTPDGRKQHAEEFENLVRAAFIRKGKHELFYGAHSHRELIYGLVQDAADLLENPQYAHDQYFQDIGNSNSGNPKFPGRPFKLSKTPWDIQKTAPTLGQHTEEILIEKLKLSTGEFQDTRRPNEK